MTTPLTPPGFDVSYMNSWDYILNPQKYARHELIRRYGYATTPEIQAVYDRIVAKAHEKVPMDEWVIKHCSLV